MTDARHWTRVLACVAALTVIAAACGGGGREDGGTTGGQAAADPGITDTEIKLGSSYALSGPASVTGQVGRAQEAFWRYVNEEKGGVTSADGKTRTVAFTMYDDAYTPPRTVENARRLVEQDQVFALLNPLGTPTNTAIWDYVNQREVPHVFVYSGADKFYADVEGHPWSIGWQVPYPTESAIYVEFLKQERPQGSTVAVLYQNDDFGRDYLEGFERAAEGTNVEIVARESYEVTDPTVDAQVANLSRSGADVFFMAATQKPSAQAIRRAADLGWSPPLRIVSNVSATVNAVFQPAGLEASSGIYSIHYWKDPSVPAWRDDPAVTLYREKMARYCQGCVIEDQLPASGWTVGQIMEKALEAMEEPTREGLMEAVRNMDNVEIPMLLPGITVDTSPTDGYPIEAAQIVQFNGQTFENVGDVIDVSG